MSEQHPEGDFMDDPAVIDAMVNLMDALDAARARRKLKPGKGFAVISTGSVESGVASSGCKCVACRVKMISVLGEALGANMAQLDLSAAADAARAVH